MRTPAAVKFLTDTKATLDIVGNPGGIGDSFSIGIVNAGRQQWDPQYGYTDALFTASRTSTTRGSRATRRRATSGPRASPSF